MKIPHCMECNTRAHLVNGNEIYPHRIDLATIKFWKCPKCSDSYCGCHKGTTNPLGRPVGAETRKARMILHSVLDPIWKDAGYKGARREVYDALSNHMGLTKSKTHVALFDIEKCRIAYRFLKSFRLPSLLVKD